MVLLKESCTNQNSCQLHSADIHYHTDMCKNHHCSHKRNLVDNCSRSVCIHRNLYT